ncbi:pep-cterm exosortase interaction domain-containing protein [Leptolyngbya sp. Heron Island J]|uniref:PEP-CTERM sorting domain-containing protein n=1 Tax=Leptolyngbya sp. Heron Island J TaxID=1385935 RepID=UPI0003B9BD05|nr:PEP-CTERM sorting domain-containing protein [Leptolyngbya sp. Heron Island J]ESA32265.1 pep-cterm exosortase interaction domain-containing protein [Leptolyngbya sp. Heron Island J]
MKRAVLIAAIATISSGFLRTASANAAQFQTNFLVGIINGDFLVGDTFTGQVIYDDDLLSGTGLELIDPNSGLLSLTFDYVAADLSTPVTYTENDDDIDSGFPLAIFQDGALVGLDYAVAIASGLSFQFREEPLGSGEFGFFTDNFSTFELNTGTVAFAEPTAVPEPAALAGLIAIAGLALRRRQ